ncbi:hypothetical protein [Flammeovirga aprica]|uniref:Uncharacterized protein n=1 Tax=Flammeovirga aprica JL-4 TaxID=694437 RepID=A0A7X9X9Q8_9BACT|nr:hypothetical protein [Flammeovirga aprica]NME69010.1 hypothetical protein [Flammeovirga aprica JL-4]
MNNGVFDRIGGGAFIFNMIQGNILSMIYADPFPVWQILTNVSTMLSVLWLTLKIFNEYMITRNKMEKVLNKISEDKVIEKAQVFFKNNPKVNKVFVFGDGMLFSEASKSYADEYSLYYKSEPISFERSYFEENAEEAKSAVSADTPKKEESKAEKETTDVNGAVADKMTEATSKAEEAENAVSAKEVKKEDVKTIPEKKTTTVKKPK